MSASTRRERLLADRESLERLKEQSSIFDFEHQGEIPDRYTILFRGKGIGQEPRSGEPIEWIDLHRVDVRLPYSYPERPPDIRWQTPLFHPNVSFSGFINLSDIGLPWDAACTLDVVCDRLWDVARLAFLDLDHSTNYTARAWFDDEHGLVLPVDPRPLRGHAEQNATNIIHYERRTSSTPIPPVRASEAAPRNDVFYINEDTPVPELPVPPRRPPQRDQGDSVFYIGED